MLARGGFLLLLLVMVSLAMHAQRPVRFAAEVRAGEPFRRSIGRGLVFVVKQEDGGSWRFAVQPLAKGEEDYTDCLRSPVLHGVGVEDLVAWRFAPGGDPGYAEAAPVTRVVRFVTDAADQRYECAERDALLAAEQEASSRGQVPREAGLRAYRARRAGRAKVLVTAVRLRPGSTEEDADFRAVRIRVSVVFPSGKARAGRGSVTE